jgi:hypothetical protein
MVIIGADLRLRLGSTPTGMAVGCRAQDQTGDGDHRHFSIHLLKTFINATPTNGSDHGANRDPCRVLFSALALPTPTG